MATQQPNNKLSAEELRAKIIEFIGDNTCVYSDSGNPSDPFEISLPFFDPYANVGEVTVRVSRDEAGNYVLRAHNTMWAEQWGDGSVFPSPFCPSEKELFRRFKIERGGADECISTKCAPGDLPMRLFKFALFLSALSCHRAASDK